MDELRTLTDVAPVGVDEAADLIAAHRVYQVAENVRTNFDTIAKHPGVTVDGLLESGHLSAHALYDVAHRVRPVYGDVERAGHLLEAATALPAESKPATGDWHTHVHHVALNGRRPTPSAPPR